jgi:hypothetical protein
MAQEQVGDNFNTVFFGACGKMFQGNSRGIAMIVRLHKKKCDVCRNAKHKEDKFDKDGTGNIRTHRGGMDEGIGYSKNGNLIKKPKIQNVVEKLLIEEKHLDVSGEDMIQIVKKTVY